MSEYWFKPKLRGIGPGVPLNWKGWALFGAYIAAILSVPSAMILTIGYEGSPLLRFGVVGIISVPFLFLMWRKTEGGWRWRRGGDAVDDDA
ncbi:MAG: hypothetical protein EXR00_02885 [Alphaproteobacteria bacterium]|nr:hypothetical protein [Alphaproteobacteria bacterium]